MFLESWSSIEANHQTWRSTSSPADTSVESLGQFTRALDFLADVDWAVPHSITHASIGTCPGDTIWAPVSRNRQGIKETVAPRSGATLTDTNLLIRPERALARPGRWVRYHA